VSPRLASGARANGRTSEEESAPYEGALQGVGNGVALGWVVDRSDGDARVSVSLVIDGEIVAEGIADVARPDLLDAGRGDGAHGFLLALPERLQKPGRRTVLVLAGDERTPLPATPSFWQQPSPDGAWSDVVFVPGGALSACVPPPPEAEDRRAVLAAGWLLDLREEGRAAPDEGEMEELAAMLLTNAQRCAELGILYVPALVPRKRDVIAPQPSPAREWVARLNARLRDVDEVDLLDLLGVLRDGAARHGGAYHRTDADWNDRGAFYVARALLKEAHRRIPALRPPAPEEMRMRTVPEYRGTLAQVPALELKEGELRPSEAPVPPEPAVAIDPAALHALRMPVDQALAQAGSVHLRVYATPESDGATSVAVLGDAAALGLLPWLTESAGRCTFFWARGLPIAQLEIELPRVVFHLMREADLEDQSTRATHAAAVGEARSLASPQTAEDRQANPSTPSTEGRQPAPTPPSEGRLPAATVGGRSPTPPITPSPPAEDLQSGGATPNGLTPAPATENRKPTSVTHSTSAEPGRLARWGPALVLAAGIVVFCALMLYDTRKLGFWQDEWSFVTTRLSWSPDTFLRAFNQQPMMLTVLVYKLLLPTAGLQHTWPYRLALFAMHSLCVTLLWLLARKRMGDWLALVPAALLLVLGAAWEDLTLALQINYLGSLAAGLGALLCLERRDRRGDRLACALLTMAWMWSSVGVPFALGVAVELAWRRRDWRRWWVVAGPLGLYAVWYLAYGSSTAELVNVRALPHYFVAGSSATLGGLIGVEALGKILLVGCTVIVARRLLSPEGLAPRAAMGLGGFLAFWLVTDLNRAQYGQPNASRYMYPAAVFVLIVGVALLRRVREADVSLRGYLLIGAALAGVWLSGYDQLLTAAYNRDVVDTEVKAELGAVDVAGPAVGGAVLPDAHHAPVLTVADYRAAERTLHSHAGFTVDQMLSAEERYREMIDEDLTTWEGIQLAPASASTSGATSHGKAPALSEGAESVMSRHGACEVLAPPTGEANHELKIASGNTLLMRPVSGRAEIGVSLRRFAAQFLPASTATVGAGESWALRLPTDDSTLPWRVRVNSNSALVLCQIPQAAPSKGGP
jgi:hypothetical protein